MFYFSWRPRPLYNKWTINQNTLQLSAAANLLSGRTRGVGEKGRLEDNGQGERSGEGERR